MIYELVDILGEAKENSIPRRHHFVLDKLEAQALTNEMDFHSLNTTQSFESSWALDIHTHLPES